MPIKKENPIPVRFTTEQLAQIERVAARHDISKQEAIRRASAAGLNAMESLEPKIFNKLIEKEIKKSLKK